LMSRLISRTANVSLKRFERFWSVSADNEY
jgi:hypothetical protein